MVELRDVAAIDGHEATLAGGSASGGSEADRTQEHQGGGQDAQPGEDAGARLLDKARARRLGGLGGDRGHRGGPSVR